MTRKVLISSKNSYRHYLQKNKNKIKTAKESISKSHIIYDYPQLLTSVDVNGPRQLLGARQTHFTLSTSDQSPANLREPRAGVDYVFSRHSLPSSHPRDSLNPDNQQGGWAFIDSVIFQMPPFFFLSL